MTHSDEYSILDRYMADRDLLEEIEAGGKIYKIYEEHAAGKFIFYAEGPGGERTGERSASALEITDPSADTAGTIVSQIKSDLKNL